MSLLSVAWTLSVKKDVASSTEYAFQIWATLFTPLTGEAKDTAPQEKLQYPNLNFGSLEGVE